MRALDAWRLVGRSTQDEVMSHSQQLPFGRTRTRKPNGGNLSILLSTTMALGPKGKEGSALHQIRTGWENQLPPPPRRRRRHNLE